MKKARGKFHQSNHPTKSQMKRDMLFANMLILQQLVLQRAADIVDQFIAANAATECDKKETSNATM